MALTDIVSITFKENNEGEMEETGSSIATRIYRKFGFDPDDVIILEASYVSFRMADTAHLVCDGVSFTLNGIGWSTNFSDISRAPEYDEENHNE
jgi:hypothetical protein